MFAAIIGTYGLIVGSFLNAYVWRSYHEQSIRTGRSRCVHCKQVLGFRDLVPVLSWLWLKGRCRQCQAPISRQYPVVEVLTAVVFVLTALTLGMPATVFDWVELLLLLAIFSQFIALGVTDVNWRLLPDRMNWVLLGLVIALLLAQALGGAPLWDWLLSPVIGAVAAFGFFYGLYMLGKGNWMGGGDAKLVFVLGLFLGGIGTLIGLMLAFNLAALISLGLIGLKLKQRSDAIPFGPFLLLGAWLAGLFGAEMTEWYLRFIGVS